MIVVLAATFLAFHLPYLPASLEDLDSINFALGVRDFDVAHHQPHPPGYPVFILLAKTVHAVVPAEATALALTSVVAASLGVLALMTLFRRLDGSEAAPRWSIAAVAMTMTTPLYWFTAARPLSDSSGLAAAVAVQAMALTAATSRGLAAAAFCAGLAAGLRSQVIWLTVPLLALRAWQGLGTRDWGLASPIPNPKALVPVAAAFLTGIALWLVPLLMVSGGPSAYWHALFDQGAEDLGNIQMLWNNHGVRDLRDASYYAFVAPWAAWPLAAAVLACACGGVVWLVRQRRSTLVILAVAFGPYLVFDLLFQETFTSRYALPLVVPIAYLAVAGLRAWPWDIGLAGVAALAMFSAHLGGTSVAAYSRAPAPAFQLLDAMHGASPSSGVAPVLAPDRRESLDLRRPRQWAGDARHPQSAIRNPQFAEILAAPPQHEWLEAVKYWNGGGRAPVWFVVDPMRASIDLVQHGDPQRFRWPLPYPVLLSGARPNEMDWYRVDRPEWYVGEGWSLTPEAAGVADADRRTLAYGPIDAWIDRRTSGGWLMIGGRNLDPSRAAALSMELDGRPYTDAGTEAGRPFLHVIALPDELGRGGYAKLTVKGGAGDRVAIEQFDASASRPMIGYGEGWHEPEFNPRTGERWRWLSDRAEMVMMPVFQRSAAGVIRSHPVTLHLEGESPRKYFSRGSRLIIRSGDRVVFDEVLTSDFARDVRLAEPGEKIVLETDQTYVPAERSSRTQDRRRLGLRVFRVELRTQD